MHVQNVELLISAVKAHQFPPADLPEIALIGRSNVGKSSFINAMISRKNFARTSGQPGKTQTINFYQIDSKFRFVDLPGYGYARVSKSQRKFWAKMIEDYLSKRTNLDLIFILMDFRHPPSDLDKQMVNFLEDLDLPYAIILTKTDKVKSNQWQNHLNVFAHDLDLISSDALFPFSVQNASLQEDIWAIIEDYALEL